MPSSPSRWGLTLVCLIICTPSLASAFDFATSQTIDGKLVTCSSVTQTETYTQCNDLQVEGLYFPNGVTCGLQWSATNSAYSDTAGFCDSLTGSNQIEAFYTCDSFQERATWFNHIWGSVQDNGYTQHLRCFRDSSSVAAPAFGAPALLAMAALLAGGGARRLAHRRR